MDQEVRATYSQPEYQTAVLEDIERLQELISADASQRDLRQSAVLLRKLLLERSLVNVAHVRSVTLMIGAPNNKEFIEDEKKYTAFVSGGGRFAGALLRAYRVGKDLQYSISRDGKLSYWKPSTWLDHRVIFYEDRWIRREEIIKFVAYSAQGIHSDTNSKLPFYKTLQDLRKSVIFTTKDPEAAAAFRAPSAQPHAPTKDELDAVFFEFRCAIELLVNSPDVIALCEILRRP